MLLFSSGVPPLELSRRYECSEFTEQQGLARATSCSSFFRRRLRVPLVECNDESRPGFMAKVSALRVEKSVPVRTSQSGKGLELSNPSSYTDPEGIRGKGMRGIPVLREGTGLGAWRWSPVLSSAPSPPPTPAPSSTTKRPPRRDVEEACDDERCGEAAALLLPRLAGESVACRCTTFDSLVAFSILS